MATLGRTRLSGGLALAMTAGLALPVCAGTGENALLIIDPTNPVSVRVGNHYKAVRNIPDSNVLYLHSGANSYAEFVATNQAAFVDTLAQRGIGPMVDYVVLAPSSIFSIPATGLIVDSCSTVRRFSISSCYAFSQISSTIIPNTPVETTNQVYSTSDVASWFDASVGFVNGVQSGAPTARRFYIGALLGYTGATGNSPEAIMSMIDRSAAVDGTRPAGTFYYMNNPADTARNVRQPTYAAAVSALTTRGALAQQLSNLELPTNRQDILGIMTGASNLNFAGSNMNILPGAFCDHLTSYAATLDSTSQTKVSAWIDAGASASAGTVEEPCNYTGKFPHARLHVWYYQGMPLGAAYFRSLQYMPYQNLFYGDPLTRPFARIPTVSAAGIPSGPVSGTIVISPTTAATAPGASILAIDLVVDGVVRQSIASPVAGRTFTLDTSTLSDGWHDVRIVARDNSAVRNQGRWVGSMVTRNFWRTVSLGVEPDTGDLSQTFVFTPSATGGTVTQSRLLQNSRVIAATPGTTPMSVPAGVLGPGVTTVQVEVTYADGRVARSAPTPVTIAATGQAVPAAPIAASYRRMATRATAHVVEFPTTVPVGDAAIYSILSGPTQATIVNSSFNGPYRIIRPNSGAAGTDTVRYRVQTAQGIAEGVVTLVYTPPTICLADYNVDGVVDPDDLSDYIAEYFSPALESPADYNRDGTLDPDDLADFIASFFLGC